MQEQWKWKVKKSLWNNIRKISDTLKMNIWVKRTDWVFSQIDKNNHVPRKILCNFMLWMERTFWGGRRVGCGVNTNKQTHIILWNQNDFEFLNSNIGNQKTVEISTWNSMLRKIIEQACCWLRIEIEINLHLSRWGTSRYCLTLNSQEVRL